MRAGLRRGGVPPGLEGDLDIADLRLLGVGDLRRGERLLLVLGAENGKNGWVWKPSTVIPVPRDENRDRFTSAVSPSAMPV